MRVFRLCPMNQKPLLILFDVDGTLVHSKGAGRAATRAAMLKVFGTCGNIDSHEFSGKTDWYTAIELLTSEGFKDTEIQHRMPTYEREMGSYLSHFIGNYAVEPCHGALDTVRLLMQMPGIHLGVVTGNMMATTPIKLRAAGFTPEWFPIGAYGNESTDRNNLPAIALERANAHYGYSFTPDDVIVVGDTPMDIACARALGAIAVAVATGNVSANILAASQPDYLLKDLTTFATTVIPNGIAGASSLIS
jgi:phosphoglycolate phosphatase